MTCLISVLIRLLNRCWSTESKLVWFGLRPSIFHFSEDLLHDLFEDPELRCDGTSADRATQWDALSQLHIEGSPVSSVGGLPVFSNCVLYIRMRSPSCSSL